MDILNIQVVSSNGSIQRKIVRIKGWQRNVENSKLTKGYTGEETEISKEVIKHIHIFTVHPNEMQSP